MALASFNKGSGISAGQKAGVISGMILGRADAPKGMAMNALKDGANLGRELPKIAATKVVKAAGPSTIPFAPTNDGFNSTINKEAAAKRKPQAPKMGH